MAINNQRPQGLPPPPPYVKILRKAILDKSSSVEDDPDMSTHIQSYVTDLQQAPPPYRTDDSFLLAAKRGRADFVEAIRDALPAGKTYLLGQLKDPDGYYASHFAAANGHQKVIELLLEIDTTLCRVADHRNGWTPLHKAISNSHVKVMKLILHHDLRSLDDLNNENDTCLHIAVKHKKWKELKVLVEYINYGRRGEIFGKEDAEGNTVLHIAASDKLYKLVATLVDTKQVQDIINRENAFGLRALNLCDRGTKDLLTELYLRRAGACRNVSLIAVIDPFFHSVEDMSKAAIALSVGADLAALQILGKPFGNSASNESQMIEDVLIRPGNSFRKFYGALSLTIFFLICTLIIVLSLWANPSWWVFSIPLPFLIIFYFMALASNLSDLSITCGSLHIQSIYFVWMGFICFFLTVTVLMFLGNSGKKLTSYIRYLNRK